MGTSGVTKERHVKGSPYSVDIDILENILEQTKKSICKIICNNDIYGTGFFCFLPFPDKATKLRALITNNHILGKSDIEIGKTIKFTVYNDKMDFKIIIDKSRKVYTNEDYDITIIELKPQKDGIKDDSYLDVDDCIILDDNIEANIKEVLKDKSIYLIHYPGGEKLKKSEGVIISIDEDKYTIHHNSDTNSGSSGSPILNLDNNKLIGIHVGAEKDKNGTIIGTLLREPFKYLMKNI